MAKQKKDKKEKKDKQGKQQQAEVVRGRAAASSDEPRAKMSRKEFDAELEKLQV